MNKMPLILLALVLGAMACTNTEKTPAPVDTTAEAPAAKTEGAYTIDSAATDISFVIVSNSAGPITARFPNGVSGSLDASGKGTVNIQLDTMKSLDQNNLENPLRDANVIEAFFGVRASAIFPEPVDKAWEALTDKLDRSVANAQFNIEDASGLDSDTATLTGNLVLWNKISIPLSFNAAVTKTDDKIELTASEAVSFDLEQVLGSDLRKLAFDTMLAAGCAHQPGIQNEVAITLHKVVLNAK